MFKYHFDSKFEEDLLLLATWKKKESKQYKRHEM